MKTEKTTVSDLFETRRRYVVPLFQRGYVWNLANQWEPLWDDLLEQAADVARHRAVASYRRHKHFLGAVVLNQTYTPLKQVPMVEIIDGQQRLTTLQILLAAIRDGTKTVGNQYTKAELDRVTANQEPLSSPDERFKVWPTSSLQTILSSVMRVGSLENLLQFYGPPNYRFRYKKWDPPRPPLVEAYIFFAEKVREYLDNDSTELPLDLVDVDAELRADVLVEALLHGMQLVTIDLEPEDDAQVIFETLNARGEPLTPTDLVRNFIFLTATKQGLDVAKLHLTRWSQFENAQGQAGFWKQEERQGRLKRSRMDLFLFHYVTFRTGEEIKAAHVYRAFREWWESDPSRDTESALVDLGRYAQIYRRLLEPDTTTRFGRLAQRLRILDTTVVYPFVLWAAGELGTDSVEMDGIAQDLESYLTRRAVCGYGAKSYSRLFLEWYGRMRDSGAAPSRDALRSMLSSSDAESARWPSDEDFHRHLVNDPIYQSLKPRRTQMILEALNEASIGPWAEKIEIKSPLSIEHVMPQWPSDAAWPLPPEDSAGHASSLRRAAIHTLGNLTLLTQPLNSSISNGPYALKRPEIAKQSMLALNTYFQDQPDWSEVEIRARGQILANKALDVWPRP